MRENQLLRSMRDVLVPPYRFKSNESGCCLGNPGKFHRFSDSSFQITTGLQ